VKPIPNQADGTVDLEYVVEERANDQIEISGGWGSGQIVGTVGLRFNNFSTGSFTDKKSWRPLPSGDGQQLNLRIQSNGKWYQSYSLSFVEPWLGGKKPNALSFSLYHTIQKLPDYTVSDVLYSNPEQTVTGASLGIGVRLTWPDDYFQMRNEISYRRYKMNNWSYSIFANGESNDFSFVHTIARNSVDNPLYSRGGSSFKLTLSWTPPYSLLTGKDYSQSSDAEKFKWLEYHKWEYEMQWFTRIAGDLILMSKGTFGFVGYYNKDIGPTPFGKYKLGGDGMSGYSVYGIENVALRGYQNSSLSPNTGDNLYNKFTMEIRYPLSLNPSATVYGLAFAEGGKSWEKFEDYNPFGMYRSLGVGVRMFLPMLGMIGIDWGYGFDAVPDNPSANGSQWHFVLGQQF
jgi:outer membrane protein insertion porin family